MQQKFYSPMQSMNAFMVGDQMGQQKRKRETQNAFSQMIGDKDYSGARDYAYGRGAMELGGAADGILAGQSEQQKAQDTDKARMAYEGLKAVSQQPDPQSRMQMAQQLSQQLGIPAPDDPNDLSDHEIARQLEVMRIQGGFEETGPEAYTLAPGAQRFEGDQMVAENPKEVMPKAPAPGMIQDAQGNWVYSPEYLEGQERLRAAGRDSVSLSVGAPGQPNPYAQFPDGTVVEAPPGTGALSNGQFWEVRDGRLSVGVADNSAASKDAQTAENKAQTRRDYDARSGRTVLRDVNRGIGLLNDIYGSSTSGQREDDIDFGLNTMASGAKRVAMAQMPGTAEYVFKRNIRSAKSNIGLDRLQGVRDFSPTGGALGQIPVQQQEKLEETIGALDDLGLPRAFLEENLRSANNDYLDIVYGSPSQRAQFVAQGVITPADNAWIDAQYDSLGYDAYGNYMLGDANYTRPVVGVTLPDGSVFTEDDLATTMEANGMSRLEVEAMVRASLR